MKTTFHKIFSLTLAVCMLCSLCILGVSAAAPYTEGAYTAKITILHESKDQASMSNAVFDQDADLEVKGATAELKLYVAFPMPNKPEEGTDGTVKDVKLTLDGQQFQAVSDLESRPERRMDATNPMFGVNKGDVLSTQVLTFTFPADKLAQLEQTPAKLELYENVAMKKTMTSRLKIAEIAPAPTRTSSQSLQLSAMVEAPASSYDVVIPEVIAMGALSRERDNIMPYTVQVNAENLGTGRVVVSAPAEGRLISGENALPYSNSFGSQSASATAELQGTCTVTAAHVAAAAAGDYVGTASFAISYYAGK